MIGRAADDVIDFAAGRINIYLRNDISLGTYGAVFECASILDLTQRLPDLVMSSSCHRHLPPEDRGYVIIATTYIEYDRYCIVSREEWYW